MSSDQAVNGSTGPPSSAQLPAVPQHHAVQAPVHSLHQGAHAPNPAQQGHHQHMLASMPQSSQMDAACSHLLMNPHTAAIVASVAAAAAQQMVQQQQHAISQAQSMQQSVSSSNQPHQLIFHPPPTSATPPPAQMAMPPHLAALLGMPVQAPSVYSQHGTPVAPAQVVVPSSSASGNGSSALFASMQNWKLKQLEAHVQVLRDTNQVIPQPVAILLADARRKEEKRTAKRVANRKSACTSRARKKALVEEMTRTNARLKRQAMILALLPDLVIATTIDGQITFCSAQVERVLRHKVGDLVGANLNDLLTPSSRKALHDLSNQMVAAELAALENIPAPAVAPAGQAQNESVYGSSNGAAVVSDQSFPPLSVVKVKSQKSVTEGSSDLSTSNNELKHATSGKNSNITSQSTNSSVGNEAPATKRNVKQSSSDDSLSSSSENKNLLKANENLDRNVRWHNEKSKASKPDSCHKDDVTGEAVTANNAGARLSSLQHRPETLQKNLESLEVNSDGSSADSAMEGIDGKKKAEGKNSNGSSSDESGYRESREDTESSDGDELSTGNGRPKPLAPTCTICLIREDLTTIWCEVTSSIRTRSLKEESIDIMPSDNKESKSSNPSYSEEADDNSKDDVKELLLCLRPIRDGDEKVDATLRFRPVKNEDDIAMADGCNGSISEEFEPRKGPVKKRPVQKHESSTSTNTTKLSSLSESNESEPLLKKSRVGSEDDPEKSVVESLMLMGQK